jgi:hypothetical protein
VREVAARGNARGTTEQKAKGGLKSILGKVVVKLNLANLWEGWGKTVLGKVDIWEVFGKVGKRLFGKAAVVKLQGFGGSRW